MILGWLKVQCGNYGLKSPHSKGQTKDAANKIYQALVAAMLLQLVLLDLLISGTMRYQP